MKISRKHVNIKYTKLHFYSENNLIQNFLIFPTSFHNNATKFLSKYKQDRKLSNIVLLILIILLYENNAKYKKICIQLIVHISN